jgi:uncharacterized protein YcaQ
LPIERLSLAAARRVALAAQGFAEPRPTGKVDRRHFRRAIGRMGLIQIDSVNVLARSQELTLFARLGSHPRDLIAEASQDGELFEYWSHAASHIPTANYHLYRWHMNRAADNAWKAIAEIERRHAGFLERVFDQVAAGPLVAADISQRSVPKGPWWDWDDAKTVLEHLFRIGRVTAYRRRSDFARVYDLPERRIPAVALDRPGLDEHDSRTELLALAAKHLGVGTLDDLTDYHRQLMPACKPLVAELIEAGRLLPVQVEGWTKPAFLHPDARVPRRVEGLAVLSPFDPVVWYRNRNERLFGFHYRIEIYTPPPKRIYGYFVMPVLLDDEIVGRVDLKADRAEGALLVQSAFVEPGVPPEVMAGPLADELRTMAAWLELDRVEVRPRGDAAAALAAALGL